MKIRSVITTLVGALALTASSLVHAGTGCMRWDFSVPWTAIQDNGYKVEFRLDHERPDFGGSATQSSPPPGTFGSFKPAPETRAVTGTIDLDSIKLLTAFGGRYVGSVDSTGRLTGMTVDAANRVSSPWSSDRQMNCLRWRPPVVAASNDFNQDGRADIVWHNRDTGETQVWFMQANQRIGRSTVGSDGRPALIGPPFAIVGSRDFNRDGVTDLVWYNSSTGETQLWFMRYDGAGGTQLDKRRTVVDRRGKPLLIDWREWQIVGTGDLDGDGNSDIVWHDSNGGRLQVWRMNGNTMIEPKMVIAEDGGRKVLLPGSRVAGIHDMDNDGDADLVIYTDGDVHVYQMNGLKIQRRPAVRAGDGLTPVRIDSLWRITGADDYNRDGFGDIFWHNKATGETQLWKMDMQLVDGKRVPVIRGRFTVSADRDGGGAFVGAPWIQMSH